MQGMRGPHDLGGRKLGPIAIEQNEPVFHSDWERSVFGATICTIIKGAYTVDEFRSGIEQMDPHDYLAATYYEKWLFTMEYHLRRGGVLDRKDIAARLEAMRDGSAPPVRQGDDPELLKTIDWLIPNGASSRRDLPGKPRYRAGDRVRGRQVEAAPHTRIPLYCQGRTGVVERVHAAYPLPDRAVRHEAEQAEHL